MVTVKVDTGAIYDRLYLRSAMDEDIEALGWLDSLNVKSSFGNWWQNGCHESVFREVCMAGKKKSIDYMLEKNKGIYLERGFIALCSNGHLELAKKIYSDHHKRIQMLSIVYDALIGACAGNHYDMCVWLVGYVSTYGNAQWNKAFIASCKHPDMKITKWLHDKCGSFINAEDSEAFVVACTANNIDCAQWLHARGADIRAKSDIAFKTACDNGFEKLAVWLASTCDKYKITYLQTEPKTVIGYEIKKSFILELFGF
jgi:hypothetical protein